MNETSPHRPICLNTWSPCGGSVWEGLGGVILLGVVCHWKELLRFRETPAIPSVLPAFFCGLRSKCSQVPAAMSLLSHYTGTISSVKLFSKLPCSWCFITAIEKQYTTPSFQGLYSHSERRQRLLAQCSGPGNASCQYYLLHWLERGECHRFPCKMTTS